VSQRNLVAVGQRILRDASTHFLFPFVLTIAKLILSCEQLDNSSRGPEAVAPLRSVFFFSFKSEYVRLFACLAMCGAQKFFARLSSSVRSSLKPVSQRHRHSSDNYFC
jgi:hypothetical protein